MRTPIRRTLALAVIAAMCVVFALPAIGAGSDGFVSPSVMMGPDMYEPNDTTATATWLMEGSVTANIQWTGDGMTSDRDLYKFSVDKAMPVFLEARLLESQVSWDSHMTLWSFESGMGWSQIKSNDDNKWYWDNYGSNMSLDATPGVTYMAQVRGLSSDYAGSYEFHLNKGIAARVYGDDRFGTAEAINRLMWSTARWGNDDGPEDIVVANAYDFPDALTGGVIAGADDDGTIFLTPPDHLPEDIADSINRTAFYEADDDPVRVYVIGGTSAISPQVYNDLAALDNVSVVYRLAGATRFETAVEVAKMVDERHGSPKRAFIVNANSWADAMTAGFPASDNGDVILLTEAGSVPQVTMDAIDELGITEAVVVGGTSAVSTTAFDQLKAELGATKVVRLWGADRYATARALAQYAVDNWGLDGDRIVLTTGENFVDGLTATPMVSEMDGPLLLTPTNSLSPEVAGFVDDNGPMDPCYVVGGPGAVSDATFEAFDALY